MLAHVLSLQSDAIPIEPLSARLAQAPAFDAGHGCFFLCFGKKIGKKVLVFQVNLNSKHAKKNVQLQCPNTK